VELLLGFANTQWSPKEFLFPRTEPLLRYRQAGDEVVLEDPAREDTEVVLFGVRACDAAGVARLDEVFLGPEPDPFYACRRERTTVVSLACAEAGAGCFCTAVGGSPAGTEGADLQVVPLSASWLVLPLTAKGRALVADHAAAWTPAGSTDRQESERLRLAVEESMGGTPVAEGWPRLLEASFDDPVWERIGSRCLGCGICAYVCPSCSCFDVSDEDAASCGTRCRLWDSCAFASFTRHASGHNPRPNQPARYRHRVLHKFAYFPLLHEGRAMCVGCGRCLRLCPVGLDIHGAAATAASSTTRAPVTTEEGKR
jgi:ferredoxin